MTKPLHASKHCRHYSYVRSVEKEQQGPRCACGIDLREKPGASLMCMPDGVRDAKLLEQGRVAEPCAWREEFTDEEHSAWNAYRNESMARMLTIMPLIPGSHNKKEDREFWGKTGSFPCPCCDGGTVKWLRSRSNGHVHARCTSPDCFAVVQ